ncbi:hypothetical protein K2X30_00700 [bacterium]|nr:hypothetical protein [bacterium]
MAKNVAKNQKNSQPAAPTETSAPVAQEAVPAETTKAKPAKAAAPPKKTDVDRLCDLYGDLIFDVCESVLWSPLNAQVAFRAILKRLRVLKAANQYEEFERMWVLKVTCDKLREFAKKHGRRLSPSEQIMLDATLAFDSRIRQFDSYFHRLTAEDQLLLLLRDKLKIPDPEIAGAMGYPIGSIKILRQQAFDRLEEWIWDPV